MRLAFLFDKIILDHEPLGPMYIASYVRTLGHDVEYFNVDEPDFERLIRRFDPEVLGYSVATGQQVDMINANLHLRQTLPHVKMSLFGGPHPTFFPEMLRAEGVDAICIGEGELPTAELLDALEKGDDYTGIENLHFKHPDGTFIENPKRAFLPHLDELPFPDHDIKARFPHLKAKEVGFFIAGRGCPFHCTFCFNDAMMTLQGGRYVRYRDPDKVCDEIEMVRSKYPINLVSFQDDIFGIQVKWLEKFAPIYRERIKLPFMCHFRADLATERATKALYEAGCVRLIVGLESGDADLRQRVMDKRVSDEELLACSERAHRYGIELLTQNMFGIPGETVDTALATIEMNIRVHPEVFIHYFFIPYPMTKLGDIAREMGVFDGNFDVLPVCYHSIIPLAIPNKRQIERLALNSYLFIDMPFFFWLTKGFFRVVRREKPRLAWLRLMRLVDKATKRLGLRKRTCWYHEPELGWRFDNDATEPKDGPPFGRPRKRRRVSEPPKNAFGVAPNLAEVERC